MTLAPETQPKDTTQSQQQENPVRKITKSEPTFTYHSLKIRKIINPDKSGSICVGVTMWFGWGGVVSGCIASAYIRIPHHPNQTTP